MRELHGWGRYPRHRSEVIEAASPEAAASRLSGRRGVIARGNGRAYGDAAIGERATFSTLGLDRMRGFEPATGRLTTEAGVLLADILDAFVPRGFFPPVVPGTRFVTVGGMVASDVHGKNHHRDGGFGDHVEAMTLLLPDGRAVPCTPEGEPDLFRATIGGQGLTGTILDATFRLKPIETGWMVQRTVPAGNMDEAFAALDATADATYSVAWIDCVARGPAFGRSLIFAAEHATRDDLAAMNAAVERFPESGGSLLQVPIELPAWALNRASVAAFNEAYFRAGAARAGRPLLVPWKPYFFPLDGIGQWNRIYGRSGFLQHQCVIPAPQARRVLGEVVERLSRRGNASFLAVLKQLGPSRGMMSFPVPGYTLALDVHVTDDIFPLLDEVDRLVVEAGGRLYLAKDARQSQETFEATYPELGRFREVRRGLGAEGRITSRLSARLGI